MEDLKNASAEHENVAINIAGCLSERERYINTINWLHSFIYYSFRIEKKAMEKAASNLVQEANIIKRKAEMERIKLLPKIPKK